MPASEAQLKANAKYRQTQKRIEVVFAEDVAPRVQEYAAAKGLTIGALLKECLSRCMQLDGLEGIPTNARDTRQAKQASTQAD